MLSTAAAVTARAPLPPAPRAQPGPVEDHRETARAIGATLELLRSLLAPQRRMLQENRVF